MSERVGLSVKKSEGKERTPSAGKMRPGVSPGMDMGSPVEQVLHLQRTIGNRAVTRLVESGALQARLRVGAPNDIYEQEAERIADQVMGMQEGESAPAPAASPSPGRQEEEPIQARASDTGTPEVTPDLESSINALKSGGQPLPASSRAFFEPRFGADFSRVRLHTDTNAAQTAQALNARAFTTEKDIVLGSGQYSPGTSSGKHLLAHELTHVLQQRNPWQPVKNYFQESYLQLQGDPGVTTFTGTIKLYENRTGSDEIGVLEQGCRIEICDFQEEWANLDRFQVRVLSGRLRGREGYVNKVYVTTFEDQESTIDLDSLSLVFFQNPERESETEDVNTRLSQRQHFLNTALDICEGLENNIYVDPRSQNCIDRSWPIEYFYGTEIMDSILGAANCTNGLVNEIHIVSHGGSHGIAGTGDAGRYYGLYLDRYFDRYLAGSENLCNSGECGFSIRSFVGKVKRVLSNGVKIRLYGCETGLDYIDYTENVPGIAEALANALRDNGLDEAHVYGRTSLGDVAREGDWQEY